MQVHVLTYSCGHHVETIVPGTALTCWPYVQALRALPCCRCLGRRTARDQVRRAMDTDRLALYRRGA